MPNEAPAALASAVARAANRRFTAAQRHLAQRVEVKRVLVAEDDTDLRRLVGRALRNRGYEVIEARDGTALLARLASTMVHRGGDPKVDLIVTDVRMPGESGLHVLAGLRRAGWDIPVILVTAFGDAELHQKGLELGAVAVLDKPFEMAALVDVVRSVFPSA